MINECFLGCLAIPSFFKSELLVESDAFAIVKVLTRKTKDLYAVSNVARDIWVMSSHFGYVELFFL